MTKNMLENTNIHGASTQNPCKLCTPLGASLAFKGIRGAVPLLHGSQGCATYIRRYLISHYKEPVDIAASNFSEETAVFGGGANLKTGLQNISSQYGPELIGIATTCLSETIGDDVPRFLREYVEMQQGRSMPKIVHVSTPSYRGTHRNGFHDAVRAVVDSLAESGGDKNSEFSLREGVNVFPGMVSPADMRHLKEILEDFGLPFILLPDYSETLDGGLWPEYRKIPAGGTPIEKIRKTGNACASIELGRILMEEPSAGKLLEDRFQVPCNGLGLPIGILETDRMFETLERISGKPTPEKHVQERERLVDAYVDGHKHVMEAKAAVYGEEDLVVGLCSFLSEIGVIPVVCASSGKSRHLEEKVRTVVSPKDQERVAVLTDADFKHIEDCAAEREPDFFIGNSKGYSVARRLKKPLVRVGFPIHDRVGGSRVLHVGYRGAQQLFDRVVNTLIAWRQESSVVGYTYF